MSDDATTIRAESVEEVAARAPLPDAETAELLRRLLFGGRRRRARVGGDSELEEDRRASAG